jgi:hypothetical protein
MICDGENKSRFPFVLHFCSLPDFFRYVVFFKCTYYLRYIYLNIAKQTLTTKRVGIING